MSKIDFCRSVLCAIIMAITQWKLIFCRKNSQIPQIHDSQNLLCYGKMQHEIYRTSYQYSTVHVRLLFYIHYVPTTTTVTLTVLRQQGLPLCHTSTHHCSQHVFLMAFFNPSNAEATLTKTRAERIKLSFHNDIGTFNIYSILAQ